MDLSVTAIKVRLRNRWKDIVFGIILTFIVIDVLWYWVSGDATSLNNFTYFGSTQQFLFFYILMPLLLSIPYTMLNLITNDKDLSNIYTAGQWK